MSSDQPQTWHYGLIARYWAEFNDHFRPHEIPYFQRFIEPDGEPALVEPGGTLLPDAQVPYVDARRWKHCLKEERAALPEPMRSPRERRAASDGTEFALTSRVLDVDLLAQRSVLEMRVELWRDGELEADETRRIDLHHHFVDGLSMMIERAGFGDVVVHGDHVEAAPRPDDEFVVFVAR